MAGIWENVHLHPQFHGRPVSSTHTLNRRLDTSLTLTPPETSRLTLTRLVSLGAIQTLIFLPCSESQSSLLDPIAQPVCLSVLPTRSSEAIIPELHIPTPKGHATHKKYTSRDNQKCAASRMCSTGAAGRTPKRYGTSAKGRRRTVAGSSKFCLILLYFFCCFFPRDPEGNVTLMEVQARGGKGSRTSPLLLQNPIENMANR